MDRIFGTFAIVALSALAGCGGGDSAPAGNAAQAPASAAPQSVEGQLEALPEAQRNGVFIRAIRDAGNACQHVESSAAAGEYQGMPVWRAQCGGGSSYTIVITGGGVAQVLDDSQVELGNQSTAADNGQ